MPAHFNPEFDPADVNTDYGQTGGDITVPTFTADYSPFKFWCQKTLPLVFDDSLSYYEVLCKLVTYVNNLLTDLQTATGSIGTFAQQFVINQEFLNQMAEQLGTNTAQLEAYINARMVDFSAAYEELQAYVNLYFANLDVQEEINTKLDQMAQDGTLDTLLQPFTEDWLENMTAEITADLANQNQTLTNQNARISVLEGRMDTFSTLPAGSTSANAELVDIRTNFLGETYSNAGEAVRASDLIASGYYPLMYSGHKDDWYLSGDDALMSDACNTLSFDITKYKGGKLVYIFNVEYNVYEDYEMGAKNIIGKGSAIIPDSAMTEMEIFPANGYLTLLRNYTDSGSVVGQRLLFIRDIPEDETAQYYYLPYTDFQNQIPGEQSPEHLAPTGCVFPNYMFYVTNWSKTPVDLTLTQAGEAADAKATGDAIGEVNERLDDITKEIASINIFDQNNYTITEGKYLNPSTGNEGTNETYCYQNEYTPCKANTNYRGSGFRKTNLEFLGAYAQFIIFYDANKQYISGATVSNGIITTPANCAFFRVSLTITGWTNNYYLFAEGTTVINTYVPYKVAVKLALPFTLVDLNGDGDFTSISDAIAAGNEGDTIIILPGVYNENVKAWGKKVHLIGTSRESCIIFDDSGNYTSPPVEIGAGSLQNLSIIEKAEGAGSAAQGAYAVHVESNNLFNEELLIRNCYIYSDSSSAIGMGLRGGCTVRFEDNEIICAGARVSTGAAPLYFHDADGQPYWGTANLYLKNNVLRNTASTLFSMLTINSIHAENTTYLHFMFNIFVRSKTPALSQKFNTWNSSGNSDADGWNGLSHMYLEDDSFGNNLNELNY